MGTGLSPILPVQICYSPYDVAALNNLYAEPIGSADPVQRVNRDMSLTPAQQTSLSNQLQSLQQLAQELNGNPDALLELLRQIEQLHRTVQDGAFRGSLPSDRSQLFNLLQNMERSGGWPYIPRLQLRTFMDLLQLEAEPDAPAEALAA
jgi:hypothetical protein